MCKAETKTTKTILFNTRADHYDGWHFFGHNWPAARELQPMRRLSLLAQKQSANFRQHGHCLKQRFLNF